MAWQRALSTICKDELLKKSNWTTGCLCSMQYKGGGTTAYLTEERLSALCQQL